MSKDTTKYNTRMFAEKVIPHVKDMFPDWEDEVSPSRWQGQRAAVPAFRPGPSRRSMSDPRQPPSVNGFSCRVWNKGSGEIGFLASFGGLPLGAVPRRAAKTRTVIVPSLQLSRRRVRLTCSTPISTGCWRCARSSKAGWPGPTCWAPRSAAPAAEMAAIFPGHVRKLALIAPFGLFDETDPAADLGCARTRRGLMCRPGQRGRW